MAWMTKRDEGVVTEQLVTRIRSLRFGLLGGALAHALVLLYPNLLPGHVSLPLAVYLGSLTGVLVFEALAGLFRQPARSIAYYTKLTELGIQKRSGLMDEQTYKRFKAELDEEYFQGYRRSSHDGSLPKALVGNGAPETPAGTAPTKADGRGV